MCHPWTRRPSASVSGIFQTIVIKIIDLFINSYTFLEKTYNNSAMFNNPSWNIANGLSNFNVHLCSLMISSFPFVMFPRSKLCLHPWKLPNRTYKKKKQLKKRTSEPIHLHFWGVQKCENFPGFFHPPKPKKEPQQIGGIWRTPGALQRQIPTSSSITNQHGLWDLFGMFDFCSKGKLEEYSCYLRIIIYRVIS